MPQFLIQYKVKPELVAEQEAAVRKFVDAVKAVGDPEAEYASFRTDDVSFVHVARFASEEAVKRFQAHPHFEAFSKGIRERAAEGPNATKLTLVASTRD